MNDPKPAPLTSELSLAELEHVVGGLAYTDDAIWVAMTDDGVTAVPSTVVDGQSR